MPSATVGVYSCLLGECRLTVKSISMSNAVAMSPGPHPCAMRYERRRATSAISCTSNPGVTSTASSPKPCLASLHATLRCNSVKNCRSALSRLAIFRERLRIDDGDDLDLGDGEDDRLRNVWVKQAFDRRRRHPTCGACAQDVTESKSE